METATPAFTAGDRVRVHMTDELGQLDGEFRDGTVLSSDALFVRVQADGMPRPLAFATWRVERLEVETITVTFTVPAAGVETLRREVGLMVDQLGPVREWLEKQGGQVAVTGMPSTLDIA